MEHAANIVFFAHPAFLNHQSMPRFVNLLKTGMASRGHEVDVWSPDETFHRLSAPRFLKKWLGYVDQFVVFPIKVRRKLRVCPANTLFVITDQALGPWVPLISDRPHVIHCHDFLAQRSAVGEIHEHKTGWTGRQYQRFIRNGFTRGRNFISVSRKSRADLHRFLGASPAVSEVIYNGLNQQFSPGDVSIARSDLSRRIEIDLTDGYILHVGGNQWYKNRSGVISLYNAWRAMSVRSLPLLCIGEPPSPELTNHASESPYVNDIHFVSGIDDETLRKAYVGASVFLFPSLAEGFGWPIAEAMASGCPVITTDDAPMTEVAGDAALLIPVRPGDESEQDVWARNCAPAIEKAVSLSGAEREAFVQKGICNARRFAPEETLQAIELIYHSILNPNQ